MENNIQLFDQTLAISPIDKAALIDKLFQSFDSGQQQSIDQAWADEAESRIEANKLGVQHSC
jgi:putative addiction module component (TIGR02574 family)